jgi:hypothetical protein
MKELFLEAKHDIDSIVVGAVLDEPKYHRFAIKYAACFEAGIGAEAIYNLCKELDLKALARLGAPAPPSARSSASASRSCGA